MPRDQSVELQGVTVNEWTNVVRRARLGRTTKFVALMLATYADPDGSKVFPGIARLVVQCEVSRARVSKSLFELRKAGLLDLVAPGNRRRGQSDEYRLAFAADLLERVTVLTPDEEAAAIARLREAQSAENAERGASYRERKKADASSDDQCSPESVDETAIQRSPTSVEPADQRSPVSVDADGPTLPAESVDTAINARFGSSPTLVPDPPPSIGPLPEIDPPSQVVALGAQPQEAQPREMPPAPTSATPSLHACLHYDQRRRRSTVTTDGDCLRCDATGLCPGCALLSRHGQPVPCHAHSEAS